MTDPTRKTDAVGGKALAGDPPNEPASQTRAGAADTDLDLVARAKRGEAAAFGDLVDRHQKTVYGIVSRMVSNRDDVDDLVQEIFVSAYRAIGGFRENAKFSTWLHSIAVNATLKWLKKMKRRYAVSIDDPDTGLAAMMASDDDSSPEESLEQREKNTAVRKAIDLLPDKQRIVVVMHYFEQLSCEDIARALDCSVGTIWSRLHYACRRLRNELEGM